MLRQISAAIISLSLSLVVACNSNDDEHTGLARGQEACEPISEYKGDPNAPEECVTWACATDDVLVCDTGIAYGETCEPWAEEHGCPIEDVIRVHCGECSNWGPVDDNSDDGEPQLPDRVELIEACCFCHPTDGTVCTETFPSPPGCTTDHGTALEYHANCSYVGTELVCPDACA